jgi:hypothetical protein
MLRHPQSAVAGKRSRETRSLAILGHSVRFSRAYLARRKHVQQARFGVAQGQFLATYEALKETGGSAYTTPWWDAEAAKMASALLPVAPANFLQDPTIRWEMIARGEGMLAAELPALEEAYGPDELLRVLEEDVVGGQELNVAKYHTCINSIHHAYHIHRFVESTGRKPSDFSTVLEWGGGYGNLAKIFLRWAQAPVTYIIVDIPFMAAIQWLYLSCVLGFDRVALVHSEDAPIEEGKVNILPVGLAESRAPEVELFVSTWALSESSAAAQQLVTGRKWFGASNLLLGYQDTNDLFAVASEVGALAEAEGATIHPIDFIPGCHYAFL